MNLEYENFKEHIKIQNEKDKERKERRFDGENEWRGERGGRGGRGTRGRGRGYYNN